VAAGGVRISATRRFRELFQALPEEVQSLAVRNSDLLLRDPNHPLLRLVRLPGGEGRFSVQAGERHRVLGVQTAERTIWVWIGSHADYERLTGS